MDNAGRLFADAGADLVFVRRRGQRDRPNRANPGRYWFTDPAVGANSRAGGPSSTPKLVIIRTIFAYAKFASVRSAGTSLGRLSGGDERAYGVAKKAVLVGAQASRERSGLDAIFLLRRTYTGLATTSTSTTCARDRGFSFARCSRQSDEVVLLGDELPDARFLYVDDSSTVSC